MDKKIHPFILLNLLINSIVLGMFAYDNYSEHNIGYSITFTVLCHIGYSITFTVLCIFFVFLTIYGFMNNSKINRAKQ